MSAQSRKPAKAIDRPFDPAVLAKAKRIAQDYQVVLSFEEGYWYGRGLELPNIMADGKGGAIWAAVGAAVERQNHAAGGKEWRKRRGRKCRRFRR